MRVLLTGGAGFIGQHVHHQLVAEGHEVTVLDSFRPDVHAHKPTPRPGLIVGDIRDADCVAQALEGIDTVIHLAAKVGLGVHLDDIDDYVSTNSLGTAILLKALAHANVRHLVYASSMVVYGEGRYECDEHGQVAPGPRRTDDLDAGRFEPPCPYCGAPLHPGLVTEDAVLDPRNAYATSKLSGEHLAATWARETDGRVTALRFHNVYGPGMPRNTPYAGVAAIFRSALERGEAPRVFEDGRQRRDFVHVRDIATAVTMSAAALPHQPSFTAYNVGSGTVHTIGDLATELAHSGPSPVITGQYRLGDVRHITASSDRLKHDLGWKPVYDLATGLRDLVVSGNRR
ncbi:NAD-dependent epimerase/dehydratase family protein [Kribbella jiaozuonensis]|uniref:NAD-dependent epimerase/dehydratase family protein n=1 Tax=Kribbella jiaozuonensis TaxID=2575441 RepID=A0A4U3LND9_9ACTN|nr:NAD-dependent epimerase/dehydratase family protein [Kribbella jiaozuonensis]TKK76719.1 NAD-dependent epimerase/dehydratase family protein [Kribbella jiaozuonensis]